MGSDLSQKGKLRRLGIQSDTVAQKSAALEVFHQRIGVLFSGLCGSNCVEQVAHWGRQISPYSLYHSFVLRVRTDLSTDIQKHAHVC